MRVRAAVNSEQFRYVLVGVWNTVFGLAVFTCLYAVMSGVGYAVILLGSQIVATLQAHFAQRHLVWASRGPYIPELLRFSVVYAASYVVNLALLAFLVEVAGQPVLGSQFAVTAFIVILTFLVNRAWTFRHRRGPLPEGEAPGPDPHEGRIEKSQSP